MTKLPPPSAAAQIASSGQFFTLTELSERLEVTRDSARNNTVCEGCPHTPLGAETYFVTDDFVAWLRGRQIRLTPSHGRRRVNGDK